MYFRLFRTEFLRKECPVCGKKNWLIRYAPRKMYLDGIPDMPMKKYLKQYCMCPKCGCVYHYKSCAEESITEIVRGKKYQDIWQSDLDEVAKKLTLMQCFPWDFGSVNREWAHYYAHKNQPDMEQAMLLKAIEDVTHDDTPHDHVTLFCETTPQFPISGRPFELFDYMYLVDLYRRTRQFDKAMQQIATLRNRDYPNGHPNLMNYLKYEEVLIHDKNSQLK